jgi:peptidoglycan-associated lipoprotein
MTLRVRSFALLAIAAVTLSGCRGKPETTPEPMPPAGPSGPTGQVSTPARPMNPGPTAAEIEAARADSVRRVEAVRNTLAQPIYFDYDADEIRADARAVLEANLPNLLANRAVRLRISGHTDERGSDEYNLALGQRRAAAARRFLETRGVDPSRIDIVSFGEERPVGMGASETAWASNRRDEFEIVAGAETLTVPSQ